jgi:hypothetical protein
LVVVADMYERGDVFKYPSWPSFEPFPLLLPLSAWEVAVGDGLPHAAVFVIATSVTSLFSILISSHRVRLTSAATPTRSTANMALNVPRFPDDAYGLVTMCLFSLPLCQYHADDYARRRRSRSFAVERYLAGMHHPPTYSASLLMRPLSFVYSCPVPPGQESLRC